ncbi:MAG: hypothetical protein HY517_03985 [Candidatus Aenigmarchaeota archaeon]|nr:hypothetical protein [Candidatus Aenigmarchaeota archaeon]
MPNGVNETERFALGLTALRREDGGFDCAMQTVNQGIPVEIVVMQLRALIKQWEREYQSSFQAGTE